ncbi:MAG: SIS domain-containing protein [Planctomycetota bacterium]|jgi:glucosamine--fructose-6-phosphate aminotransferase (isomerizing)
MNLNDEKYSKFALCKEMLETAEVVRTFTPDAGKTFAEAVGNKKAIFMTGEGSSRIFPAKRAIYETMKTAGTTPILTDGATQAMEYALADHAVFGASNSGKTKELVRLFKKLQGEGHDAFFGLVANESTPVEDLAHKTHVLSCGKEDAVAATKSVTEQALFYDSLLAALDGKALGGLKEAGDAIESVLTQDIDPALIAKIGDAGTIYFAGRNNGVAEELTLKTNEITRKKSDYLEGTYAVHGIEEVMNADDVVIIIDPFPEEEAKFKECLVDGVGMTVIAVASRETSFPTVVIPDGGKYKDYVELAAGWNLLVEIGIALGIDLDKPVRARKVGNEFEG